MGLGIGEEPDIHIEGKKVQGEQKESYQDPFEIDILPHFQQGTGRIRKTGHQYRGTQRRYYYYNPDAEGQGSPAIFQNPIVKESPPQDKKVQQGQGHVIGRGKERKTAAENITDSKITEGIQAGFHTDVVYGGKQRLFQIPAEQGKEEKACHPQEFNAYIISDAA
jgi:hypothetical protein